jgi:hypothetical protein
MKVTVEVEELTKHYTSKHEEAEDQWQCSGCQRWVPFSNGQDDDFPGWCDECWAKHEAAKKEEGDVPEWFAGVTKSVEGFAAQLRHAAQKEETPVPEWFADDPQPPSMCAMCGNPYKYRDELDQPELCSQCYMKECPLLDTTDTITMKQQLVDAFCTDCHNHIDQWFITFRHIWDTLED